MYTSTFSSCTCVEACTKLLAIMQAKKGNSPSHLICAIVYILIHVPAAPMVGYSTCTLYVILRHNLRQNKDGAFLEKIVKYATHTPHCMCTEKFNVHKDTQ